MSNYKERAALYFEKIINNIYNKKSKNPRVYAMDVNTKQLIEYYEKNGKVDFQEDLSKSFKDSLKDYLEHSLEDDMQRDEGQDIELEQMIQEEIDKNKLPADSFNKEEILESLEELSEDEENQDLTNDQVKRAVKAAAIKAIYMATLKRYEINREKIQTHTDIVNRKYGDFALEDRLATENREYEVYLSKLAEEYKRIEPKHRSILEDKKIVEKRNDIRDEHNKEEEIKEKRREEAILAISAIYDEKEVIMEDLARMSSNPDTFNQARFEDLQNKLWKKDKELADLKASPAVLIENIERDSRQKEIEYKELDNDKIAQESEENEKKGKENDDRIIKETNDNMDLEMENTQAVIDKYWECREKGNFEGAVEQYEILKTMSGSVISQDEQINDLKEDGKEDYKTEEQKNSELKENLGLNAVNDPSEIGKLDQMDKEVSRIEKELPSKQKYQTKDTKEINNDGPVRTINNRRPY